MNIDINPAKIWLIVKPSIGVPLFFLAVALTSLIVHAAILTHTNWYPAYLNGKFKPQFSSTATPVSGAAGFVIV